jgi:hypothetical protein
MEQLNYFIMITRVELWICSLTAQAEVLENAQKLYSSPHGSLEIKKKWKLLFETPR